jgi:opacity protein-like surface antigen
MEVGVNRALFTILSVAAMVAGMATSANAQVLLYGVGGSGGVSGFFGSRSTITGAGGGEVLLNPYVGAGGEVGMFDRLIVTSLTGTVHPLGRHFGEAPSPFLVAGYTKMGVHDGEGSFDTWTIGGGLDVALAPHHAIRLEFRDNVRPDQRGTVQYWSVRVGVVFKLGG